MITLPNSVTPTATRGEGETLASTDVLSGNDALPQNFLTELGNQLLTLAKHQGKAVQTAEQTEEKEAGKSASSPLNALLAALENPDALNALLKPENTKAGTKSADDKDKQETAMLSASEVQNVQALFAMLPAAVSNSATVSTADGELMAQGELRRSTASLTQALTGAVTAEEEQPDAKNSALPDTRLLSRGIDAAVSDSSNDTVTQTNDGSKLMLNNSFQQLISSVSVHDEQFTANNSTPESLPVASTTFTSTSPLATPLNAAATVNTPSTPMLNAQLGSEQWQQALSQQVVMFSRNGQQNAELRLHPEDLGAIQISLKLDHDTAHLNLVSGHSLVRAALEAALPQLRNALAESGINLGESQVSSDSFAQGQSFRQQQEARRDGQHGSFSLSQDSDNDITPIAVPASLQAQVKGNGAVDTFA